ncbi:MAG TPA: ribosomal protein S18-alanine N-acetyltransferase [Blastocatellia bacterium]|nr:ribosomal protein S18-alanine N-acetyltransferase [Blastocatellia bacterium]
MHKAQTIQGSFRIEPMRASDIAAVEELERQGGLTSWGAGCYRRDLDNPHFILLVARKVQEGEPRIVGFLNAWVVADEFQLNNMAVSPSARRQGIGSALLAAALRLAGEQGAARGVLDVRAANQAAQALYRRFGFSVAGVRRNYYHNPPDDSWLMVCEISRADQRPRLNRQPQDRTKEEERT